MFLPGPNPQACGLLSTIYIYGSISQVERPCPEMGGREPQDAQPLLPHLKLRASMKPSLTKGLRKMAETKAKVNGCLQRSEANPYLS